jgi:hypothetical protein
LALAEREHLTYSFNAAIRDDLVFKLGNQNLDSDAIPTVQKSGSKRDAGFAIL